MIDEVKGGNSTVINKGDIYNDEISLYDLVLILWRNKITGIAAAVVVMVLVLAYLFVASPVYTANVHLLPPLQQDIQALNVAKKHGLSGYEYEVDEVYDEFILQLNSLSLRWDFFKRGDLLSYFAVENEEVNEKAVFNNAFNMKLTVDAPDKKNLLYRMVLFETGDAKKAAQWLNEFVGFASNATKEKLIENVHAGIAAEIAKLETQIASKRSIAEQRRQDEIVQMEEALQIARKLKIQKPSDYRREYQVYDLENESVAVNTADMPLYTRGTIALEAEIEALRNRKSNEPFIDGLRDAEERLYVLQALTIDPNAVRVATIDQAATVPIGPSKPNKKLIFVVGVCLAVFLGVMAAFFAEFMKGLREKFKSEGGAD